MPAQQIKKYRECCPKIKIKTLKKWFNFSIYASVVIMHVDSRYKKNPTIEIACISTKRKSGNLMVLLDFLIYKGSIEKFLKQNNLKFCKVTEIY
jgi:hypothetical protein